MLVKLGDQCDVAANRLEAVTKASEKRYALILMDVQMPVMDRYEAAQQIRNLSGTHRPYIIALTAYTMMEDEKKCLATGIDSYLSNPLSYQRLSDVMTELMEASPSLSTSTNGHHD